MYVVRCLLVGCVLFVGWLCDGDCRLSVVRCLLFVTCCLLLVVCYLLFVVRCLFIAGCRLVV